MHIELKKFGEILTSRPAGKEAYLSAKAYILPGHSNENIIVDFEGVKVLTPSWGDEFLSELQRNYPGRVSYIHTENPSVKATLETLAKYSSTSS